MAKNKTATIYLHSDKSNMWDAGKEVGLTEKQLENFRYTLYEVKFDIEINSKGEATILKVNGVELKTPVRG